MVLTIFLNFNLLYSSYSGPVILLALCFLSLMWRNYPNFFDFLMVETLSKAGSQRLPLLTNYIRPTDAKGYCWFISGRKLSQWPTTSLQFSILISTYSTFIYSGMNSQKHLSLFVYCFLFDWLVFFPAFKVTMWMTEELFIQHVYWKI